MDAGLGRIWLGLVAVRYSVRIASAPAAGFHWEEEDFAGEDSLHAYLIASTAAEPEAEAARAQLLSYNGDYCRATFSEIFINWMVAQIRGDINVHSELNHIV